MHTAALSGMVGEVLRHCLALVAGRGGLVPGRVKARMLLSPHILHGTALPWRVTGQRAKKA